MKLKKKDSVISSGSSSDVEYGEEEKEIREQSTKVKERLSTAGVNYSNHFMSS